MVAYLNVFYGNRPMGVMSWDSHLQQGWFELDAHILSERQLITPLWAQTTPSGTPLTTFSLGGRWPRFRPAFLTDHLPGPYALSLLRHALRASGKGPEQLNPLAWCALVGRRGMGLIGFQPAGYPELDPVEPVDISRLVRHLRLLNEQRLSDSRLRELLRTGLFTTSDRPSALLAINDFTGAVLSGQGALPQGFQAWVCYLDGVESGHRPAPVDCLTANRQAAACGVDVLESRPLKDGQLTHFLVRRPDRTQVYPEHLLSFPALMQHPGPGEAHTETFGTEPAHSCEALFRCLRLLRRPYTEQAALFRRLVYYGLRYQRLERPVDVRFCCSPDGVWRLSPSDGFPPVQQGGMSLNGRFRDWTVADFRALGVSQHIRRYEQLIAEVQSALTALT